MNGNLEIVKSEVEKELGINTKIISCNKNGINLEGIGKPKNPVRTAFLSFWTPKGEFYGRSIC